MSFRKRLDDFFLKKIQMQNSRDLPKSDTSQQHVASRPSVNTTVTQQVTGSSFRGSVIPASHHVDSDQKYTTPTSFLSHSDFKTSIQQDLDMSRNTDDTSVFGGSVTSGQVHKTDTSSVKFSFGGPSRQATDDQQKSRHVHVDLESTQKFSFGGSSNDATNGRNGTAVSTPPPPPEMTAEDVFPNFCLDAGPDIIVIEESTNEDKKQGKKRAGGNPEGESSGKKTKASDALPKLGGKRLFQNAYKFKRDPTGKTGVKSLPPDAVSKIWEFSKDRQRYFDKLAVSFKGYMSGNLVTSKIWDAKRDTLATHLSKMDIMFTTEKDEWQTPTETNEALLARVFQ